MTTDNAVTQRAEADPDDRSLLIAVTGLARAAGDRLLAPFAPDARPAGLADMAAVGRRLERAASDGLREGLTALRPGAGLIGASVTALLDGALLVRAFVPSTFPMLLVASGQHDLFWQYEPVLPGVAAGALPVTEAGGVVSRVDGSRWLPDAPDILATSPALHAAAVEALSTVD